jgi:hypothetical protein
MAGRYANRERILPGLLFVVRKLDQLSLMSSERLPLLENVSSDWILGNAWQHSEVWVVNRRPRSTIVALAGIDSRCCLQPHDRLVVGTETGCPSHTQGHVTGDDERASTESE